MKYRHTVSNKLGAILQESRSHGFYSLSSGVSPLGIVSDRQHSVRKVSENLAPDVPLNTPIPSFNYLKDIAKPVVK
jgi:hypothetical protein